MAENEYVVQWRYRSNLGRFAKNDVISCSEEEAAHFNRDSPGVLVPKPEPVVAKSSSLNPPSTVEGRALSEASSSNEERALEGPPQDRMFRKDDLENRAEVPEVTPAAEKLAEDNDIDLAEVEGSGVDGKIVVGDIRKLVE